MKAYCSGMFVSCACIVMVGIFNYHAAILVAIVQSAVGLLGMVKAK